MFWKHAKISEILKNSVEFSKEIQFRQRVCLNLHWFKWKLASFKIEKKRTNIRGKVRVDKGSVFTSFAALQFNWYGYPYFHRNCAEYGRLGSKVARKRTAFTRNAGHSNTAPYTRPYFHCIRLYTVRLSVVK